MDDRDEWQLQSDGVEQALDHLMPRSAGVIVREAFYGTARFDDFLRRTGLTRSVLSTQLERLSRIGILERVPYRVEGERGRSEYRLTERGRELGSALVALVDWSRHWLPADPPSVVPVHRGCGAPVHASLQCEAGHGDLHISQVEAAFGPGAHRG